MMPESRNKAKQRKEEINRLLAESRSGTPPLTEDPDIDSIPGLIQDLDNFIQTHNFDTSTIGLYKKSEIQMDHYRDHILSVLGLNKMLFADIGHLIEDSRQDWVWRFIMLWCHLTRRFVSNWMRPRIVVKEIPSGADKDRENEEEKEELFALNISYPDVIRGYIENRAFPYSPKVWLIKVAQKIVLSDQKPGLRNSPPERSENLIYPMENIFYTSKDGNI